MQKNSFEPDSNQWPMDVCHVFQLQSTALPTELSKDTYKLVCEACSNTAPPLTFYVDPVLLKD